MADSWRILVVEDEALVALDIEEALTTAGHVVVGSASTMDQAVALAEAADFDVAVLDADLDGVMCTTVAVRLIERGRPFVVATGRIEALPYAFPLSEAPRVTKPFTTEELLRVVDRTARSGAPPSPSATLN
ncbi:MAG: response regulator [Alphaproteobacteria bacterium]|nr:response regulator [Alphaproteobacteria bacterium]